MVVGFVFELVDVGGCVVYLCVVVGYCLCVLVVGGF